MLPDHKLHSLSRLLIHNNELIIHARPDGIAKHSLTLVYHCSRKIIYEISINLIGKAAPMILHPMMAISPNS